LLKRPFYSFELLGSRIVWLGLLSETSAQ
jgi:hypothetical protein